MPSTIQMLTERQLIRPPSFLPANVVYETIMGSIAYGVDSDTSDMDVYGFCIPPKDVVFPHLAGEIVGFGRQKQRFEQFQQHHVKFEDALGGKGRNYDLSIYNIVKYFTLCMENNPNMLDSLFTAQRCVLHCTKIGHMIREKRTIFLHKGAWHKFKGYAYSQLHKMTTKSPQEGSNRSALREQFGFDVKFAYHVVRLLYEVEMIMSEGDIDLERHREHLKSIRRGEVKEEDIRKWASEKEKGLERLYEESKLPYGPNEDKIRTLLLSCLEEHYGDLSKCVVIADKSTQALMSIKEVIDRVL